VAQITNYSTLKSAIKGWAYDASNITDAEIDEIIQLAEAEMMDLMRVREMVSRGTSVSIDANGEGSLPANYLGMKKVMQDGSPKVVLKQRTEEELNQEYPYDLNTSFPVLYAITGETIIIRPISQTGIKIDYYARWDGITASNTTGTMLSAHPDAYLYSCRKQLAIFEDDPDDMNKYGGLLTAAIARKNDVATFEEYSRAARRRRGPKP
jgi:hypothetical protein